MITIVGRVAETGPDPGAVAGLAGEIAVAAAARGARVELVSKVGDDPRGDALLLGLARLGVGHAALLRDPARSTPAWPRPGAGTSAAGTEASAAGTEASPASLLEPPAEGGPDPGASFGLDLAPADVALALDYLTDASVVVLADPDPALVPVATAGAAFTGAALVIVGHPDVISADAASGATVLLLPSDDAGGAFAALVAEYAVGLDEGRDPAAAWASATERLGVERA